MLKFTKQMDNKTATEIKIKGDKMKNKKKITPTRKTGAERLQKMTNERNEIAAALLGRPVGERGVSMSGVAKKFTDALKGDYPLTRGDWEKRMKRVLNEMSENVETWKAQGGE